MKKYDVFISYRHKGGFDLARHLYDLLTRDHYRVSFDGRLHHGSFDTQLFDNIANSKNFLLIVDEHAFDKTLDENVKAEDDWLRQELACALRMQKNVIPVFLNSDMLFPAGLPEDIEPVTRAQGLYCSSQYFDAFYRRLKDDFMHKPLSIKLRRVARKLGVVFSILFFLLLALGIMGATGMFDEDEVTPPSVDELRQMIIANPRSHDVIEQWSNILSEHELTEDDIWGIDSSTLRYLRNAILARHNYRFKSQDLMDFYTEYDWYYPEKANVIAELNSTETYNIEFFKRYE